MIMLFDDNTNQVRLTKTEHNRIRKNAARHGEVVDEITDINTLDEALVKACTVDEIEQLVESIQKHVKTPS